MDLMKYLARVRDGRPHDADGYQPGVLYRLTPSGPAYATEAETVAAIIAETNKAYNDAGGRPLPLFASWHMYSTPLSWQLDQVEAGYPVLPYLKWWKYGEASELLTQGTDDFPRLAASGLPFSVQSYQWEQSFLDHPGTVEDKYYLGLSDANTAETVRTSPVSVTAATAVNPVSITTASAHGYSNGDRVTFFGMTGGFSALNGLPQNITVTGASTFTVPVNGSGFAAYSDGGDVRRRDWSVSPLGTSDAWTRLGAEWVNCPQFTWMESEYASPPRVLLVSNNESPRLEFFNAADDVRYSGGSSAAEKGEAIFDATVTQWGAFFTAMAGATSWPIVSVAYNGSVTARFHTTDAWWIYNGPMYENTIGKESHYPQVWGGASPEIYDNWWQWSTEYPAQCKAPFLMWSPQNEAMTFAYIRDNTVTVDADHWFEISSWDGEMWSGAPYGTSGSNWPVENRIPVVNVVSVTPNGTSSVTIETAAPHLMAGVHVASFQGMTGGSAALNTGIYATTNHTTYTFDVTVNGSAWAAYAGGGKSFWGALKAGRYEAIGITGDADYYKGWLQYCLWIIKPRAVRDFRDSGPDLVDDAAYSTRLLAVRDLVAHVHQNPTLRRFWRSGVPVYNPNTIGTWSHPFQQATTGLVGTVWENQVPNWNLETNLDPTFPAPFPISLTVATQNKWIPVYTLAHVIGSAPNREWLIYAHATGVDLNGAGTGNSDLIDVVVTIPDYDDVTLPTVPIDGAFYYVKEVA
jgi:hypothetical protein